MCSIGKIPSHRSGNVTLSLTARHVAGEECRLGRRLMLPYTVHFPSVVLTCPFTFPVPWQNAKACVDECMIQPWLDVTFQRYPVVTNTFNLWPYWAMHEFVSGMHDRNLSRVVLQLDTEHWQLACSGSEIWSWRPKDQSDWSGEENAELFDGSLYGRRAERQTG